MVRKPTEATNNVEEQNSIRADNCIHTVSLANCRLRPDTRELYPDHNGGPNDYHDLAG